MRAAVCWFDGEEWRDGVVAAGASGPRLLPDADNNGLPRLNGVITGGFTDHHVHLQLVELAPLAGSTLGRVVDLGGDPAVLEELRPLEGVEVLYAGAFLTPPGGYPSNRSWAPSGSVREVADEDAAERAIAEMKDAGAVRIKVASNSTAGPVFSDMLLRAIISIAASHRVPIVVHAEGRGEAQRVVRLGAERLAHAPFSERLSDSEISGQAASAAWISTLSIHDGETYDIAVDNVRRFRSAGGTVLYGTDLGNGPMPVGLNPREIAALREARVDGSDLLQALAPLDPTAPGSRLLFFPGCTPDTANPLLARLLTPADLEA
ncbi:hydrolase [Microbacterium murale]|uniref:Hydrolase n=1 Tax=Microbacterium murale TaxID=1081040 RepID=A0ABQ1RC46_9MICO|nr:hydrolase [Microbacterium murale]GGD62287.1 hypothetical protein GCM10007269_01760 [Microbacterium murale]